MAINNSKQVLFVDSIVENYQNLVKNVTSDTEVFVLDGGRDGIEQITEVLAQREEIASVQIISHGSEGQIQLGTSLLNRDTIKTYSQQLQQWRNALTDEADILLFGCSVASGEGEDFIRDFSEVTGADVAASTNVTGNKDLGGDWKLEAATGNIDSSLAISELGQQNYTNTLAVPILQATNYGTFAPRPGEGLNNTIDNVISVSFDPNNSTEQPFSLNYRITSNTDYGRSVSANDYKDIYSGNFYVIPNQIKNLIINIPIEIIDDNFLEGTEWLYFELLSSPSYSINPSYFKAFYAISDNEPYVKVSKLADKTEGETPRVKDIFQVGIFHSDGSTNSSPQAFDLYLDISGTAIRGSFANTQEGSDYKLFYTAYKLDGTEADSRKALPDPAFNTTIYKINIPKDTSYIRLQAEDINDEIFEITESITVKLAEDHVVLGIPEYSDGDKYKVLADNTATANLIENEPIVSLGKVVNPTEGFGFGSTITGLNSAINLDGTAPIAVAAKASLNLANTGQFTQEAWIFPNFTDNNQHDIISYSAGTNSGSPSLYVVNQTNLGIGFGDGTKWNSATVAKAINPNNWNHIATTFDGTDYKIYVNAVEVFSTRQFAGKKPAPTQQLQIGKNFKGALDEVRVWNVARNAGDIQSLMVSELKGDEAGLVGYWNFNGDLLDKSTKDIQNNAADGVISGNLQVGDYVINTVDSPINRYVVNLEAGKTYTFDLERYYNGNPILYLYDSSGTLIGSNDNAVSGVANSRFTYTPSISGSYYAETAVVNSLSKDNIYRLSVKNIVSNPASKSEEMQDLPNSFNTTGIITVGDKVTGNIANKDDRDWYKVNLSAGKTYIFDISGASMGDGTLEFPEVYLYDSNGTQVATPLYLEQGNGGRTQFRFTPTTTGSYYAEAFQWNSYFNGGTYKLGVSEVIGNSVSSSSSSLIAPFQYINNPAPQIGYVEVNLDKPFQGPQGLWVKYEITGGTAIQNTDYFNSRYRKVSTDANSDRNGIIIPQGETSARIYFSALSDAVVEGDETVNIKLIPHNFDQENILINNPNTYVLDRDNANVQIFDSKGNFINTFGSKGTGNGQFSFPTEIATDSQGNIYVIDGNLKNVQVFDNSGKFLRKFGSSGTGNGQFQYPFALTIDNNENVYVADLTRKDIQIFDNSGNFLRKFGLEGTGNGQFQSPNSVKVDKNGNIYVSDYLRNDIQVFDSNGNYLRKFGSFGTGNGQFTYLTNIAIDNNGNIYAVDQQRRDIQVFNNSGIFLRKFGSSGTGNGQFQLPTRIAVDSNGSIYVGDAQRDDVQVFDSNGNYLRKFGSSGTGTGKFQFPLGIAITGFPNSNYGISSTNSNATITIKDNQAFSQGVILLDEKKQVISNNNPIVIRNGQATFQVKLSSQPTTNLTVNLSSNKGNLNSTSVTFTNANWDTAQPINVTGVAANGTITATASGYLSNNPAFNFTVDAPLRVTEGSTKDEIPVTPQVIVASQGDISEDGGLAGNFVVNLSAPAPVGGLSINYSVSGNAVAGQDYIYSNNYALKFDGVDDYVALSNGKVSATSLNLPTSTITLEAMVNIDQFQDWSSAIGFFQDNGSTEAGFALGTFETGQFYFALAGGDNGLTYLKSSNTYSTNQWYHLAAVYNGSKMELFVDGVSVGTSTSEAGNIYYLDSWYRLGMYKDDNEDIGLKGKIREVRVWNVARTQAEIQATKDTVLNGNTKGLLGYYQGNATTDNSVLDSSGNNNHGTLINGASYLALNTGSVTIPEGAISGLIPILPIADKVAESNETVTLKLEKGKGYTVSPESSKQQANLNILNDDTANIKVVNAQFATDINGNTVVSYSDNLVAVVTSEPYPNVNNVLQLWDNNNNLLGSVTLTQANLNAGKITLAPTGTLPTDINSLKAILKENNAGNQGLTLNNNNITINGGAVEINLPNVSNQASFGIRLETKPTADVTITFKNIDNTEISLDKPTVTFNPDNWAEYQVVTANGLDDLEFDGNISTQIKAEVTTTTDINYQGKTFSIDIKNLDDDQQVGNQAINKPVSNSDLPTATIGTPITVGENNNTAQVQINLSKPVTQTTDVIFGITDGTAVINQDYQLPQGYLINQFEQGGKSRFYSPFDNVNVGNNAKPTFADLDNDGDLDAIVGNKTGIKYYKNVGSSTIAVFEEQTGNQNPFANINITGAAPSFADINGDLTLDLVIGNDAGNIIYYVNNSAATALSFSLPNQLNPIRNDPFKDIDVGDNATPFLVDFDKDGDKDLIVGSKSSGLSYYQNTGTTTNANFVKQTTSAFSTIPNLNYSSPFVTDWDLDGDFDLFLGQENGIISYWENNNGTFSQNPSKNPFAKISNTAALSSNSANAAPSFVDLNGDGLQDAFVGVSNGKIDYYEQFNLVTFATGEQTKTINLQIKEDQIAEGNENIELSLYPNAGYNLSSPQNYLNLDGKDDYAIVSNVSKFPDNAITFEGWFKITDTSKPSIPFISYAVPGNGHEFSLVFFPAQKQLEVGINGNFWALGNLPVPSDQKSHHWAFSWSNTDSNFKIYQDGTQIYSTNLLINGSIPKFTFDNGGTIVFGQDQDTVGGGFDPNQTFTGSLKDLRLWNKVLNAEEIKGNKDKVLTGNETGLVAYYQGNTNSTNALQDSSPNNFNADLKNGAAVSSDVSSTVNITDNDVAGVTITLNSASNKTSETGDTVSYSVKLNTQPIAPVTVYLGSQDESEGLLSTKSDISALSGVVELKFTPDNWNQTQTFFVKGVDDRTDDDDIAYQVITTISSEDQQYNKLAVADLSLTNTDNDQVSFIVTGAGKAIEGRENIYSVRLSSQPVGDIRLVMTPSNDQIRLNNELVGEPLTITFTPQNWNFDQTVRATALDDSVVEYLHFSQINLDVKIGKGLDFESKADNNTPENALDLGTIKGGYNWNNLAISDGADIDWFKFTISDTGNDQDFAKINFDHAVGDLKLELYAASNLTTPIKIANTSTNSNNFEQISLNGQPLGKYYLKISGSANNYDLVVADEDYKYTQNIPKPLDVIIQDNDLPTAKLIAGPTASEVFGEPSYFTVQLNAPTPKGDSGINVKYRVVGGSATFPEDTNGNGILDSGEDANNNGKLDLGDYVLQKEGSVRIAPGDIQNNLVIVPIDDKLVEDHKLTIKSVTQGSKNNELILKVEEEVKAKAFFTSVDEPGNKDLPTTTNTTGRLLVGDYVLGTAATASDKDWYAVYLEANKSYTFDLESYYNGNPAFSLYNSSGTLLGNKGEPGSFSSRFTYTPTTSGNYYAEAAIPNTGLANALYRLSVDNIVNNTASKSEGTQDLPSNTSTTGVITVGDKVTGNISNSSDKDWFKVDLSVGKTYIFDISGANIGDGTLKYPEVYLYDSKANLIATPLYLEGGNGNRTQFRFTPTTSGSYYAEAFQWNSAFSGGTYKLGVSEVIPYAEPVNPFPPEMIKGSNVKFDKNLVATITQGTTLTGTSSTFNSRFYEGEFKVEVDPNRKNEIQAGKFARIAEETVIVELLPGDGYILPENPQATLRIQDDDVPGVRIVQVGDNTVVKEGETASFKVSLLSEPTDPVKIRLTPGAEIDFVNPVNPTTVNVTKDIYKFDSNTSSGNLDVNLVSLVTGEKEKTVSFGVKLRQQPDTDVKVEFYDGNDQNNNTPVKTVLFTPIDKNIITGDAPGNWDQGQQVILGYLDATNSNGDFKLTAKIKNAATGAQIGSDIVLPIIHTTEQVAKQTTEITINPEDWYKLQTVTFTGIDEQIPEPGLYHQSNITYRVTSNDLDYGGIFVPDQRVDVVDRPLNPQTTSQTVRLGLTNLQASLDDLSIPMVGSLDGKMPNLIGDISDKLVVAISAQPELTANSLKTVIEGALSSLGLDFLEVSVDMTEDNIGILLNVKKTYDLFSLPLDVDLGLDALGIGLKTEGDLKSTFNFNVALGFGLNKNFGFYIDTKQTKVDAALKIKLDDFKGQGNLGFLRLDMADDPKNRSELAITFKAGLKDLDNYKSVKFFDVDGDYRLDANTFTYPIKTNDAGKPKTTTTGDLVTTNYQIQEPFVNVNAQGITPAFTTVPNATAEQKRVNWNNNTSFDAPEALKNEGVYLTKKAAAIAPNTQPTIESYYFDLNRNGKLDPTSKEKLFSVAPGTARWFEPQGKLKPFRIEQRKDAKGVVTYYFDQNGNNTVDIGETITTQEKAKFDKNNNFLLDADKAVEGEGIFVQGTAIAFRDTNRNGQLDVGEPYVNSGFAPLKSADPNLKESNILTFKVVNVGTTTFLDQNNNNTYEEASDLDLFAPRSVTATQALLVGLPGAGTYTLAQILNLTVANGKVIDTEVSFFNKTDTGVTKKLDIIEDPLVRIKEGIRFVDLDYNGKLTLNDQGKAIEPFALPNNTFDEKALTGTGNIVKIFDDGDRLTIDELKNWKANPNLGFSDLFKYEFAGNANLGLTTKTSIDGNPAFPSVAFDLAVGLPLFNYGNQSEAGSTGLNVEFNDVTMDFGKFLTKFVTPIIKTVDDIVSPLKPVIDILNADTKLFSYLGLEKEFNVDGKPGVSILDLGKVFADAIPANTTDPKLKRIKESVPKAIKFVDFVTKIVDLSNSLRKLTDSGNSITLKLGNYNLDDLKAASDDPADTTSKIDAGKKGTQTRAQGLGVTDTPAEQAQNSTTATPQQKGILTKLKNLDGLKMPILDNPITLIRLLLGEKDVDLIKYDIPDLDYYFGKEQDFLLWTPPTIKGLLELYFQAKTDLSVGYDTHGLESWRDSDFALADVYKILDGFYVDDWDKNGVDKPEFSAEAGIAAGLSASIVVAKAVLKGGIDGKLNFDLVDEGELQNLSDGKVRGSEIISRISNPLQLFDLSGGIDAFLKGEVRIGIDFGFFEIMKTIWSKELAPD